jgi:hypothetical protein
MYCFVQIVSFCVLFVCKCVLYYWHRVATQLQLNISYHIMRDVTRYVSSVHQLPGRPVITFLVTTWRHRHTTYHRQTDSVHAAAKNCVTVKSASVNPQLHMLFINWNPPLDLQALRTVIHDATAHDYAEEWPCGYSLTASYFATRVRFVAL